jgi:sensor histidine kinase YesM
LFWLAWWIYFSATYYYYVQVGLQKISYGNEGVVLLAKTGILILVHILSCYTFIYFLLPRFLLRSRYIELAGGLLAMFVLLMAAGYFIHARFFPYLDLDYRENLAAMNNTIWWTSINSVLLNAPKIIAAATAVVLVKRWYRKQDEKERVEKEKLITDLQLLKAQIRPDFFFNSLEHIYTHAQRKSPAAPKLLLEFSDLLSYLLYECDHSKVLLEKELMMMNEYITLERQKFGKNLDMEIQMKGVVGEWKIEPLLLLPFIEYSFRQCGHCKEQPWINLGIYMEGDCLIMKLMFGFSVSEDKSATMPPEIINVQKRLRLLYPQAHELKMYAEQEIYMVLLRIQLNENLVPALPGTTIEPNNNLQQTKRYAFT